MLIADLPVSFATNHSKKDFIGEYLVPKQSEIVIDTDVIENLEILFSNNKNLDKMEEPFNNKFHKSLKAIPILVLEALRLRNIYCDEIKEITSNSIDSIDKIAGILKL